MIKFRRANWISNEKSWLVFGLPGPVSGKMNDQNQICFYIEILVWSASLKNMVLYSWIWLQSVLDSNSSLARQPLSMLDSADCFWSHAPARQQIDDLQSWIIYGRGKSSDTKGRILAAALIRTLTTALLYSKLTQRYDDKDRWYSETMALRWSFARYFALKISILTSGSDSWFELSCNIDEDFSCSILHRSLW